MNPTLVTTLSFAGNFIMGVGFVWMMRQKGGTEASKEVIDIFKTRDEEQKKVIDQLREEVKQNSLALATLQGENSEKDKKIAEYLAIFKRTSPDDIEYRDDMRKFTAGVAQYMKDTSEILSGMKVFMTELNQKTP